MMLKFISIPSIKKLSNLIEDARGNVYIPLEEEKFFNLKESTNIAEDLEYVWHQRKDIVMHIVDTRDYLEFVNYMIGTTYDESACI